MGKTRLQAELACWKPVPTTIPAEWAMWIEELARETVGSPRPAHAYVLNVIRYDAREVGKLLQNWGLPWQVVAAGYLRIYDEELIKRRQLLDRERVMSHFKESLLYSRSIEEEQLGPLLSLPHRDLGALLIAVAIHYQSLVQLSKSEQRPGDDQKRRPRIESTGRILLHICTHLGMWSLKRKVEDVLEYLLRYKEYKEYEERYNHILNRDQSKLEAIQRKLIAHYQQMVGQPITIEMITCGVAGLKRRETQVYTSVVNKVKLTGFDLVVFHIIVPSVKDCYLAFGALNFLGTIQDRVADQIAAPKPNGYSLLAYNLILDGQQPYWHDLEWLRQECVSCALQIATVPMLAVIYYGCLYPECYRLYTTEATPTNTSAWLPEGAQFWNSTIGRAFYAIHHAILTNTTHISEHHARPVVVYDKLHNPLSLARGATVLDFAYEMGPQVGNYTASAYVNNRRVPLYRELDAGDVVEIITDKEVRVQDDWLEGKYAITEKALVNLRALLTAQLHRYRGYILIVRELERYHCTLSTEELDEELLWLVKRYDLGTRQGYLENFRMGSDAPYTPEWAALQIIKRREALNTFQSSIEVWIPRAVNEKQHLPMRLCNICQPGYPQEIVGCRRRSKFIVVHSLLCPCIRRVGGKGPTRYVPMEWVFSDSTLRVAFVVYAQDRQGLIHDITKRLLACPGLLLGMNARSVNKWRNAEIWLVVEVPDDQGALIVWNRLLAVDGVVRVNIDTEATLKVVAQRLERLQSNSSADENHVESGTWHSRNENSDSGLEQRNRVLKNPYDISRPATAKMFVGRGKEMGRLKMELCDAEYGKAILLYGPRRSGKTSLCRNFLERYVMPPHWYTFYSLQNVVGWADELVLRRIADEIARSFSCCFHLAPPVLDWSDQKDMYTIFREFVQQCTRQAPASRFILVLDEFGGALDSYQNGRLSSHFFDLWRQLMDDCPQLSLLIALPTRAHTMLTSNDFANVFSFAQSMPVSFLDQESAGQLLVHPLREQHVRLAPQALSYMMHLTGGNPYYLSLLGLQLIFYLNVETEKNYVVAEDIEYVVRDIIGAQSTQNFIFYSRELQDSKEATILEAIVELTEMNKRETVTVKQLASFLTLSPLDIRSRLERLRNGLILDEYISKKGSLNPYYAFKIELVRRWMARNRWFFNYR
ncbi:(p)ppGpp synthase/HD superfamily hydrolase [Thermosporothrix hazakensis]|jgi:GTP pyrophosphokinase|uniref:(P)ppGpp synthase/HD superfamily hydrolase n=1 Tax=Thermosporothrix hazakensis TaxID=644383 RepID=A0A326UWD9_THEHA|nr:TGS domain-containing protein [Thermosporothrix hazakensis]PZW36663.1 (p)ppGpp synthase/HD superfamily hydrolase [Thermosporothrix hazakensis]GCE47314.1 hypothetical protein KTH_21830 [Thermosporothrix hazakensis]